jgi:hypothetical protein
MATNQNRFIENVYGAPGPLVMLGVFQAGGTQAAKRGEMFYLNTNFLPVTADLNCSASLAIVNEEIKSGDRAGYYEIIVPRPGDIFEFDLDTAAGTAVGAGLYLGATYPTESFAASGSHPTAYACGQSHYPLKQGHLSDDAGPDMGVTVRTASRVRCMFELASSYFAAFNK